MIKLALKRCLSYVRSKDSTLELSNSRPSNIGVRIEARYSSKRLSCSLPRCGLEGQLEDFWTKEKKP